MYRFILTILVVAIISVVSCSTGEKKQEEPVPMKEDTTVTDTTHIDTMGDYE